MFQFIVNSLTMAGVIAITALITSVTKLTFMQIVLLSQAKNFNCGFYYKVYVTEQKKQSDGFGIGCIKFSEVQPKSFYVPKLTGNQ